MAINFSNYFPRGFKPKPHQSVILDKISKAWENNKKFLVVDAPTGTGKSMIAKTLANYCGKVSDEYKTYVENGEIYDTEDNPDIPHSGAAILTVTKALQDQYVKLFPDGIALKGKRNYPCHHEEDYSCDMGRCVFDPKFKARCINSHVCPYYNKREQSLLSDCAFYSYSMFLSLPVNCRKKKILICDEASELEDVLVQSYTVPIDFKVAKTIGLSLPVTPNVNSKINQYILWLRTVKGNVFQLLSGLMEKMAKKSKITEKQQLMFRVLSRLNESCDRVLNAIDLDGVEFVVDHSETALTFQPVYVDKLASKLFKECDYVILMSATFIDPPNFMKQLGVGEDEYEYVEIDSHFDPKKAPIYLFDEICVSYSNKNVTIPQLIGIAKDICREHYDQKGIIHTHTMGIANDIKESFGNNKRFLYRSQRDSNEEILAMHKISDKPTVLVSPSMTHGVDLKGKLGEFAIIMKAPFLPMNSERVKRLMKEDKNWYTNKMLSTFIQICGRTIRSIEDESVTYVLDGTLSKALMNNQHKLPNYFKSRFV